MVGNCPEVLDLKRKRSSVPLQTAPPASRVTGGSVALSGRSKELTAALDEGHFGELVVLERELLRLRIEDATLIGQSTTITSAITRTRLFFVFGVIQSTALWILADSGSARNLISREAFEELALRPPLRPTGDIRVVGGSGECLEIDGFAVLPVALEKTVVWHEFGVVRRLPLPALIGGDLLELHQCSLVYAAGRQKRLSFGAADCVTCSENRADLEQDIAAQERLLETVVHQRRNRVKLPSTFVAVLPSADTVDLMARDPLLSESFRALKASVDIMQPTVEPQCPSPPARVLLPPCSPRLRSDADVSAGGNAEVDRGPAVFVPSEDPPETPPTEGPWFPELLYNGEITTAATESSEPKLTRVLKELRVEQLAVNEDHRRALIRIFT